MSQGGLYSSIFASDVSGAVRSLGTISLLVTGIGGTSTCRATLKWKEIR